ncbi:MAG: hypothetical protein Ct9H300mP1_18030 [Planctomycetaceae bacterium]|nr:MAG: hypothetical protein Ct9H300mP1_18030 [Planctomycetaceae bacterium]
MCDLDPDIIKLVTMANNPQDSVRLLKLVASAEIPTIGFCMGELGLASRLLCVKYGSPFTYATFFQRTNPGTGTVVLRRDEPDVSLRPGRQRHADLRRPMGDPVGHSLSPLIHNAAFADSGINALYPAVPSPLRRLGTDPGIVRVAGDRWLQRYDSSQGIGRRTGRYP